MQFVYQPLTWGFFLVLVPLLIHLINLMRHRRVKWAAMDFLLQSYKKHRTWVWLKQFLLLLARMVAIAAVVAMLAQLMTQDQWTTFFGGQPVHYVVLLDDSFSMSDRVGGTTAFERAGQAVSQIAARAASQEMGAKKFTLLRFSQAAKAVSSGMGAEGPATDQPPGDPRSPEGPPTALADFIAAPVDSDFDMVLAEKRRTFDVSQLAVGPVPALEIAAQLMDRTTDERHVIYVVSDFRTDAWQQPKEARQWLQRLERGGAELHLVRCVETARPNLAITQLTPTAGTRAAGVPLFVDVTVKNFSREAALQIPLRVLTRRYPAPSASVDPAATRATADELPTVMIDRIGAGQSETRRVQVYFPTAGQHVVQAELPEDAVAVDNRQWCVVDFPDGVPVLIIDGDATRQNAYFLTSVFQPGTRANTGIRPTVESSSFLRDVAGQDLDAFRVVYLLDVDRLDDAVVEKLQQYVQRGGGLAIFLGDNTNVGFYNRWYDDGDGLFPVPLEGPDILGPSLDEAPDLGDSDHPLFTVLLDQRNPFVRDIRIDQFYRIARDWSPPHDSATRVLARLRNQAPLAVERTLGSGRVVAFLTTLAPTWNNWARQPSFIVLALELQSYLDSPRMLEAPRRVGTPIEIALSAADYRPETWFVIPTSDPDQRRVVQRSATVDDQDGAKVMTVALGDPGRDLAEMGETDHSGVYEVRPVRLDGQPEERRCALNVDTRESDLALVPPTELAGKLEPVRIEIHQPDEIAYSSGTRSGFSWSQVLLFGIVALLLGEQLLAYSASYHPARGGAR